MGLDCSHGAWHGAYSAFSRWRQELALAAGYAVWKVEHDGGVHMDTIMLDWGHITPDNLMGEWETTPSDPLLVLFAHSDCEGVIHPAQARPLAEAIESLLPHLPATPDPGHIADWQAKTQRFISGLRRAADAGEDLRFF